MHVLFLYTCLPVQTYPTFASTVLVADRICVIAADAVVLMVTIYSTYGTMKTSRKANIQAPFSRTLLCAGQVTIKYITQN